MAFDRLPRVHPSYVIHVRRDILEEVDGPMLRHGLQGLEGQRIHVPSRRVERPDEGRLAARFGSFWGGVNELTGRGEMIPDSFVKLEHDLEVSSVFKPT